MTWPFENDTSAIVKKLAGRSMQADKRNKAFLLLTIAISVCMVFSILLISTGTQAVSYTHLDVYKRQTLDNTPWFPLMGEIHYSRVSNGRWEEELYKMKAGGIELVSAYTIWIHHEEVERCV